MVIGGIITIGRAVAEVEAEVVEGEVVATIGTTTGTTIAKGIIAGLSRMESTVRMADTTVINTDATTATKGMASTASKEAEEGRIEDGGTIRPTSLLRLRQQLRAAAVAGTRLQIAFERS